MVSRFLLLSFDYVRPFKDPNISLAAASIMTHLKHGLTQITPKIELFHRRLDVANHEMDEVSEQVVHYVKDIRPEAIGAGVYVWNDSYVSHAFQRLTKEWPITGQPITILGGPQITYSGRGNLDRLYPYAQAFIRGYAEESLLQLLIGLNSSAKPRIKGVHFSGEEDLKQSSDYSLESLSSPLISGQTDPEHNYIRYETKRGCAFKCRFCQHKDTYDQRGTCHPLRIQHEVQWIVSHNITDISIVDPIFNIPKTPYLEVMDLFLRNGFKGRLNLQTRLEMVTEEFVQKCRQCLDSGINVELECGVQTVIKEEMLIIDRAQSRNRIEKKARLLVQSQIPFEVSLIYGLPMQTVHTFQESVDFVLKELRPNRVRAWPLMLLRGTELYDMKDRFKMREKLLDTELRPLDNMRQYAGIPHVISSSTFKERDWIEMKGLAEKLNSEELKPN